MVTYSIMRQNEYIYLLVETLHTLYLEITIHIIWYNSCMRKCVIFQLPQAKLKHLLYLHSRWGLWTLSDNKRTLTSHDVTPISYCTSSLVSIIRPIILNFLVFHSSSRVFGSHHLRFLTFVFMSLWTVCTAAAAANAGELYDILPHIVIFYQYC